MASHQDSAYTRYLQNVEMLNHYKSREIQKIRKYQRECEAV